MSAVGYTAVVEARPPCVERSFSSERVRPVSAVVGEVDFLLYVTRQLLLVDGHGLVGWHTLEYMSL